METAGSVVNSVKSPQEKGKQPVVFSQSVAKTFEICLQKTRQWNAVFAISALMQINEATSSCRCSSRIKRPMQNKQNQQKKAERISGNIVRNCSHESCWGTNLVPGGRSQSTWVFATSELILQLFLCFWKYLGIREKTKPSLTIAEQTLLQINRSPLRLCCFLKKNLR